MASFKQLAKKAAAAAHNESFSFERAGSDAGQQRLSAVRTIRSMRATLQKKNSAHSELGEAPASAARKSSNDDSARELSSLEGSEEEVRGKKKGLGLVYQKTENFWTRVRDMIAMSDVFIARGENPPFVACLKLSVWFIPIFLFMCIWDTLAVTVFQIPYISSIDYPGFLLGWHFVMMMLAMYGFMLSYLSSGNSPRTKLAGISLVIHYLLLFYRAFLEIYFNSFRGQSKLYYERTRKWF